MGKSGSFFNMEILLQVTKYCGKEENEQFVLFSTIFFNIFLNSGVKLHAHCKIWLFNLFFPQFCKSDMSNLIYLEVFQRVPWTFEITRFDCTICISNTAGWVANSVDPDQMLHSTASDLGLQCLLRPICLNIMGIYGKTIW